MSHRHLETVGHAGKPAIVLPALEQGGKGSLTPSRARIQDQKIHGLVAGMGTRSFYNRLHILRRDLHPAVGDAGRIVEIKLARLIADLQDLHRQPALQNIAAIGPKALKVLLQPDALLLELIVIDRRDRLALGPRFDHRRKKENAEQQGQYINQRDEETGDAAPRWLNHGATLPFAGRLPSSRILSCPYWTNQIGRMFNSAISKPLPVAVIAGA